MPYDNKGLGAVLIETLSYLTTGSSQSQPFLQLLRDCYMVLAQTLLLMIKSFSNSVLVLCFSQ